MRSDESPQEDEAAQPPEAGADQDATEGAGSDDESPNPWKGNRETPLGGI
jgi:hypothetical protein